MIFRIQSKVASLAVFLFAGLNFAFSQDPKIYYYENEVDIFIPVSSKWFMEVSLGNRGILHERVDGAKVSGYQHEHVDITNFSSYLANRSTLLSLGLRYRFKELFDPSEKDEFRIIEQVELEQIYLNLSHRFRLEQRFREDITNRIRYDITYALLINKKMSLDVGAEALYAISNLDKPEAEQRFAMGLERVISKNIELELNFEYRIEDYTRNLVHEFFFITGLNLIL